LFCGLGAKDLHAAPASRNTLIYFGVDFCGYIFINALFKKKIFIYFLCRSACCFFLSLFP